MGFSTHLGPWCLGTVKDTTGTTLTAGQVRNLGTTTVAQSFQKNYLNVTTAGTTTTIATLPAGSHIVSMHVDTTTAFTGSTAANLTIGDGTTANKFFTTTDVTAAGRATVPASVYGAWAGAPGSGTASPNGIGIGPTDINIVATMTPTVGTVTAGIVQYTIVYIVCAPDGTLLPAGV